MIAPSEPAPSAAPALAGLKNFQRNTVEYAFRRLYTDPDSTHRFLVADEVGLGKTLVARGVIAKAVEHLWDKVDRIDVVYVCSNADIARQNINRLRLHKERGFVRATRATLLPLELKNIEKEKVNFVSMTPGTSLDPRGGTGKVDERALLFSMLREHWGFHENRALSVLRCDVEHDTFGRWVKWVDEQYVDPHLRKEFLSQLDASALLERAEGRHDLRTRFEVLCEKLPRRDSRLDDAGRKERRKLVADLRAQLGQTCIRALRPDLVILDEFQRFKHLMDPKNEDAELARSLFEYADNSEGRSEAVRVLLLSATPYKMYTQEHEGEEGDHYEDFIATYDFLTKHSTADNAKLRGLLKQYRDALYRLDDGGIDLLRQTNAELEERLRKVMARTERLASTADRSGMLRERRSVMKLEESDVHQYLAAADVASALGHCEIVEYWKSCPYLLNFMDDYQLKKDFQAGLADKSNGALARALNGLTAGLLPWGDVQAYRRIDPANGRLRFLLADTVEKGQWKWLWLPPSMPYYPLQGAFVGADIVATTKRLVFSSWKVVPKVIAAVLSHEAERRAIGLTHSDAAGEVTISNTADGRKKISALLRFARAEGRLAGMPVLGLIYPSIALAEVLDPADNVAGEQSLAQLLELAETRLRSQLGVVEQRWTRQDAGTEIDERWYWAAPLLLDLVAAPNDSKAFWDYARLTSEWSKEQGDTDADEEDPDSVWSAHVEQARELLNQAEGGHGRLLGTPPKDLLAMLARSALGNPAVLALRALGRMASGAANREVAVRLAAGRIAWRLRNLFNLPEVNSLVRGLVATEAGNTNEVPYWTRVIDYAAEGCLQSVLDEYAHVLCDSLGVSRQSPADVAAEISRAMSGAIGIRSAQVGVDEIRQSDAASDVTITSQNMRARFAARFGQEQTDERGKPARSDQVRAAFNSPFWPFVLASTSVGQEGLDFHHYCHAIVHWNLPSNPVDLEQREGRIHRYKGHAVRKNVAKMHGSHPAAPFSDRWQASFSNAVAAQPIDGNELVPCWVFPQDGGAVIERYVPALPLSREAERLASLRSALAVYRMVFGQPRQDELVDHLLTRYPREFVDRVVGEMTVTLEPK